MRFDRSILPRVAVFVIAVGLLLALYGALNTLQPRGAASATEAYDVLDKLALERIESLCDRAFGLAAGMVGALGGLFLGLSKGPTLQGPRAWAIAAAVFLALASAMAGIVTRFRLTSMIAGHWPPYLTEPQVQIPFGAQFLLLFLSLAAVGWYVIDEALRKPAP
ncbi:hypothetical protein [Caulobacter sp. Root342]|nr:hypothetical protein [Caulobacter sp. Root342]